VGGFVGQHDGNVDVLQGRRITVSGEESVGGFAGKASGVLDSITLVQIRDTAIDNAGGFVGNLLGLLQMSKIDSSRVYASHSNAGGLVGVNNGNIFNCGGTTDTIRALSNVGGIAGTANGPIISSYLRGSIFADGDVAGGLVGYMTAAATLIDISFVGTVTANQYLAGMVGFADANVVIQDGYSVANLLPTETKYGAVLGNMNEIAAATIDDIYWVYDRTNANVGDTYEGTDSLSFFQLFSAANLPELNFELIWLIDNSKNSGYPIHRWEYPIIKLQVKDTSKVYNSADPSFGYQILEGDSTLWKATSTGALTRSPFYQESVGNYAILQGDLTSPQMAIELIPGNFQILPRPIDFDEVVVQDKVYDGTTQATLESYTLKDIVCKDDGQGTCVPEVVTIENLVPYFESADVQENGNCTI